MRSIVLALATLVALPALAEEPTAKKPKGSVTELEGFEVKGKRTVPIEVIIPRSPEAKRAVDSAGGDALERATERAR